MPLKFQKGVAAVILIVLAATVLIGAGVGGYFLFSKKGVPLPSQSIFKKQSPEELEGIWRVEKFFVEGQEKPIPEGQAGYYQFSGTQFCLGLFDKAGQPVPCEEHHAFRVAGNNLVLQLEKDAVLSWTFNQGNLELEGIMTLDKTPQKLKIILSKVELPPIHTPTPTPNISGTPYELFQGFWQFEKTLATNPSTGQLIEQPLPPEKQRDYIEFRGDKVCMEGKLTAAGIPKQCRKYLQFSLSGNNITLPEGSGSTKAVWEIKDNKLSITQEGIPQGVSIRWIEILRKITPAKAEITPDSQPVSLNPKDLIGFWEYLQIIEKPGSNVEYYPPSDEYLEIKEGEHCTKWQASSALDFKCTEYKPYTVSGDILDFGQNIPFSSVKWKILGDKLELEDTVQSGLPKKIYVRVK